MKLKYHNVFSSTHWIGNDQVDCGAGIIQWKLWPSQATIYHF